MLQESQHVYATKHVHIRVAVKVEAEFREYKYSQNSLELNKLFCT